ncbi:hypothetical protein QNH14_19860 [Apirhabdus apintestini]|nr:hypothetical protein QNH14_19860 [Enterobacteriaceae bacterium CA-0114]
MEKSGEYINSRKRIALLCLSCFYFSSEKRAKHAAGGEMVAPYGKYEFKLKDNSAIQSGARIVYEYINDWGAIKTVQASL